MEGYVTKRGKRIGSRVRRYMRLRGTKLSNHHAAEEEPTWEVRIEDAVVTCCTKRNRVVVDLYQHKLEMFTETSDETERWYEAFMDAKSRAFAVETRPREVNKENEFFGAPRIAVQREERDVAALVDPRLVELGSKFKVVMPPRRESYVGLETRVGPQVGPQVEIQAESASESGNAGAETTTSSEEETPTSMIFKQFTFPSK